MGKNTNEDVFLNIDNISSKTYFEGIENYIDYLYEILRNNNVGFIYKEAITKQELEKLQEN